MYGGSGWKVVFVFSYGISNEVGRGIWSECDEVKELNNRYFIIRDFSVWIK